MSSVMRMSMELWHTYLLLCIVILVAVLLLLTLFCTVKLTEAGQNPNIYLEYIFLLNDLNIFHIFS